MSDEEAVIDDVAEVDNAPEAEISAQDRISDMIAAAIDGDYVNANNQFNDILGDRVTDALDQEKVRIAAAIYGDEEVEAAIDELEDEGDDVDISDAEIEAELEDDDDESEEESETTETEEISDEE